MTRLLGLCGSLRASSMNRAALRMAAELAPAECELILWSDVGALPAFSPDHDQPGLQLPPTVAALYAQVERAAGIIIACPEYAHGIPGAFKNALDWLVGSTVFPGKPVALFNIAPRSTYAQSQLREVLTTMSAEIVEDACFTVSFPLTTNADEQRTFDAALSGAMRNFTEFIRKRKTACEVSA